MRFDEVAAAVERQGRKPRRTDTPELSRAACHQLFVIFTQVEGVTSLASPQRPRA
jgi:hypothetical protein